jgi:predicted MarR family transcription regulator
MMVCSVAHGLSEYEIALGKTHSRYWRKQRRCLIIKTQLCDFLEILRVHAISAISNNRD